MVSLYAPRFSLLFFSLFVAHSAWAQLSLDNASALRAALNLDRFSSRAQEDNMRELNVAILDSQWPTAEPSELLRSVLPDTAVWRLRHAASSSTPESGDHGVAMAVAVYDVLARKTPRFHLLNTHGITNFRAAVDYVIENNIDVVLYAQNWSFLGNYDGKGLINNEVTRALDAGVLWINSAGNFGSLVYDAPIREAISSRFGPRFVPPLQTFFSADFSEEPELAEIQSQLAEPENSWLVALSDSEGENFLRFDNLIDANTVQITLSWTDESNNDEDQVASSDLDLYLYNNEGQLIARSDRVQGLSSASRQQDAYFSAFAFERISQNLNRGSYRLRVVARSGVPANSDLRIVFHSSAFNSLKVHSATGSREIMPPADHPGVVTVGVADGADDGESRATFSASGPTRDGRKKPDLLMPVSRSVYSTGQEQVGTSTAAAFYVATVLEVMAANPYLSAKQAEQIAREHVRALPLPTPQRNQRVR